MYGISGRQPRSKAEHFARLRDYHGNIEGAGFEWRPGNRLTPAFEKQFPGKKTVLVMYSASYHHQMNTAYGHRGALCGTPGSAYPQPEPNATGLPSSAPGRPGLVELQASAPSPTPTRAKEHIASAPSPAAARRRELHTTPAGAREEHCT